MASKRLDENMGNTTFTIGANRGAMGGAWFSPSGKLGRWFSRFFASKAQPYVANQSLPGPTPLHPLAGDAIANREVLKGTTISISRGDRSPQMTQLEMNRKKRYREYEMMDEYPEVGSAFDIYADDSSQIDTNRQRWLVKHENEMVVDEVNRFFDLIKLDRYYWDIIRNTVKYGDCFIEEILDLNNRKAGIQRIKILNPNYILRVENEYGYLTDFLQEIPNQNDWEAMGGQGSNYEGKEYITLDKNQIIHFRLHTSDPAFYPYGKSIAALATRIFRSLKLMEDAMLIYRLQRAPERRIFYIDVGSLPSAKAEAFIEKTKQRLKKEKFYNHRTNSIDERYNPLSVDEDFFVPVRSGESATKIETLPGAQNLGDVDDVKYFRDKLLAALKIPKDYIVEKDQSPERKANLSQLDVKFARVILRVQHSIEIGLETLAKRHLQIKGYPAKLINELRIYLPPPSDMFEKRRLDLDEQKTRVIQATMGLGLFPRDHIYKTFYDLSDSEIEKLKKELEKEMAENPMMGGGMGQPGMMGAPGAGMPGEEPMIGAPAEFAQPEQESAENKPPTENIKYLRNKYTKLLAENNLEKASIIKRILNRKEKSKIIDG